MINLIDYIRPSQCYGDSHYSLGNWSDPFNQTEINNWNTKLERYTQENSICNN